MHKSDRLVLVKTTLSVMPIYMTISISLPPWLQKALVKIFKAFLWFGMDVMYGGKCAVASAGWRAHMPSLGWAFMISILWAGRCNCVGYGSVERTHPAPR
jgi:hypothetical protein